jgi:hypothetical protein
MSQVFAAPPSLVDIELRSIRKFMDDFKDYKRKVPDPRLLHHPATMVSRSVLEVMKYRGSKRYELDLKRLEPDEFLKELLSIHNSTSGVGWMAMVKRARMQGGSLSALFKYNDDFSFYVMAAGTKFALSVRETIKIYIEGLADPSIQAELRTREFDEMAECVMAAIELWDVAKQNLFRGNETPKRQGDYKRSPPRAREDYRSPDKVYPRGPNTQGSRVYTKPSPTSYPKRDSTGDRSWIASATCHRCGKRGHLATTCSESVVGSSDRREVRGESKPAVASERPPGKDRFQKRQIQVAEKPTEEAPVVRRSVRVFQSQVTESADEYLRLPAVVVMGGFQHLCCGVSFFVDTGANVNTITRAELARIEAKTGQVANIVKGSPMTLQGPCLQTTSLSGDKVELLLEFDTLLGGVRSKETFLVLEDCIEPIALGIKSIISLVGAEGLAKLLHQPKLPDEEHAEGLDETIDLFPSAATQEQDFMHEVKFNEDFPKIDDLKDIVRKHGAVLFAPFDNKGMKAPPFDVELREGAKMRVQPARFIPADLVPKVKAELDRLVKWGVLIPVQDVEMAAPLVIVRKPDGSIRLAVDYRELNQYVVPNASQLPLQEMLFPELAHML